MSQPQDYYEQNHYDWKKPTRNSYYNDTSENCCCCKELQPVRRISYSNTNSQQCCCNSCCVDARNGIMSCLWIGEKSDCQGRLPMSYHLQACMSPKCISSKLEKIVHNIKNIAEAYLTNDKCEETEEENIPAVPFEAKPSKDKVKPQKVKKTRTGKKCKCLCGLIFLLVLVLVAYYFSMELESPCHRGYKYRR